MDRFPSERVAELFFAARELSEDARETFLRESCGADATLVAEVASLLLHDSDSGALDQPALGLDFVLPEAAELLAKDRECADPPHIGGYVIEGRLGQGAVGTVHLARQPLTGRLVALKVIRTGTASARGPRFEKEVAALGRLEHPGIARVHEAGRVSDADGHDLWLAMEHVEGKPITTHCREADLDPRARLALLALVCDAVQHAHERGVIHRDLKPDNILVDRAGQPKVLDFGAAHLLGESAISDFQRTQTGQILGTLAYVSPEQLRASPAELDARTDVYSLGVLAYELLAGNRPLSLEGRSLDEALRAIREENPRPLSTLRSDLDDDVDVLITTALAKLREDRYDSAAQFAADIRRYLSGEALQCRPPGRLQRGRRFVRRNRKLVVSSVCVLLALLGGLIATQVMLAEARSQARRAMGALYILSDAISFVDPTRGGPNARMVDWLTSSERALKWYLREDPEARVRLETTVANQLRGLGHTEEAEARLRDTLALARRELGDQHELTVMATLELFRLVSIFRDDHEEAGVLLARAMAAVDSLPRRAGDTIARARFEQAQFLRSRGDLAAADACFAALEAEGDESLPTVLTLQARNYRTRVWHEQGRLVEAEARARRLVETDSLRSALSRQLTLAEVLVSRAQQASSTGDDDAGSFAEEAAEILESVVAERGELLGPEHPGTLTARRSLAEARFLCGMRGDAVIELERVVAAFASGEHAAHTEARSAAELLDELRRASTVATVEDTAPSRQRD